MFPLWSGLELFSFPIQTRKKGKGAATGGGRKGGQIEGTLGPLSPSQPEDRGSWRNTASLEVQQRAGCCRMHHSRAGIKPCFCLSRLYGGEPICSLWRRDQPTLLWFLPAVMRRNTTADETLQGFCTFLVGAEGATAKRLVELPKATCACTSVQSSGESGCS